MIKNMVKDIVNYFKILRFQDRWIHNNSNNFTMPTTIFNMDSVTVGKMTYGKLNIKAYGNKDEKLTIGSYCSIADNVTFFLGGEHPYNGLSTYPVKSLICGEKHEALSKGPVIIGDDVWIGYGATILSGVTIGQGAVIGAGSIVSKDVPPYAIYAGNKIYKHRFAENIIEKLVKFDYNSVDNNEFRQVKDLIYSDMNNDFFKSEFYNNHLK